MIEHDRLFKELLTPCFGDFLEVFLPEVARYVDLASLRLESSRLLLDLAPERDADLLFRARFLGQDRGWLMHLEHQAQGRARLERRLFHYFARLDEKYDVPVYPIPICVWMRRRPCVSRPKPIGVLNRAEKRKVMELTTSWKEEGLRQGRQEGRQEGRQQGQAEIVLRLLRRRCGDLPPALESRVRSLVPSELERLAEALLDFSGLPDLRRWLQAL